MDLINYLYFSTAVQAINKLFSITQHTRLKSISKPLGFIRFELVRVKQECLT